MGSEGWEWCWTLPCLDFRWKHPLVDGDRAESLRSKAASTASIPREKPLLQEQGVVGASSQTALCRSSLISYTLDKVSVCRVCFEPVDKPRYKAILQIITNFWCKRGAQSLNWLGTRRAWDTLWRSHRSTQCNEKRQGEKKWLCHPQLAGSCQVFSTER